MSHISYLKKQNKTFLYKQLKFNHEILRSLIFPPLVEGSKQRIMISKVKTKCKTFLHDTDKINQISLFIVFLILTNLCESARADIPIS